MTISCSWCGAWRGVQLARVHQQHAQSRCEERSPYPPHLRCRRERGHLSACTTEVPDSDLFLCARCFGIWNETGERPPAFRFTPPRPGPIGGQPLDLRRLR